MGSWLLELKKINSDSECDSVDYLNENLILKFIDVFDNLGKYEEYKKFIYWKDEQPDFNKYYYRVLKDVYRKICLNYVTWKKYNYDWFIECHKDMVNLNSSKLSTSLNFPLVCFGKTKVGIWWCIVADGYNLKLVSY